MAEYHELYQRAFYYDIALDRDVSQENIIITQVYQQVTGRALRSVLDIACGPGYHALQFARNGVRAVGLDLRPEMIELGREIASQEGLNLDWVKADMRQFQLEKPVDAAICMFDSLDALTIAPTGCNICEGSQTGL